VPSPSSRAPLPALLLLGACGADPKPGAGADSAAPDSAAAGRCLPAAAPVGRCGAGPVARGSLIPGPADPGHDPALAAAVRRHDRVFHAFATRGTGLAADLSLAGDPAAARAAIGAWLEADAGWDFEAWSGAPVSSVIGAWGKVAGAYAGVGVAADAFRYGALRDEGADCAEVEAARAQLLAALDGLHLAVAITGVEGVIARGFASLDNPGFAADQELTPLFDAAGQPLPAEKDNGTWRADNSGAYPRHIWEDSCSRDMLVGWAAGFGAAWEVIRADPDIPAEPKLRLAEDARALVASLAVVRESGYDLEIRDADGRMTYHGLLHESSVDRYYVPGAENGPNALMALGITGALAAAAEDPAALEWIDGTLLGPRGLGQIARDRASLVDFGAATNYSGTNMAFLGGWLGGRYLCGAGGRADVQQGVTLGLYARPGEDRQPVEQSQALYHLIAAAAAGGLWAGGSTGEADADAVARALVDLGAFWPAPYVPEARVNCDEAEVAAGACTALDGSPLTLLGPIGWNDALISLEPLPLSIRPASNYHWRSNPYEVNGDPGAGQLYSAVDLRVVYWMGRYARR
jgi:hypothetical protein